jgi:LSD1 subclass zinc finger protein
VPCEMCDRPTVDDYLCGRCAADLGERLGQLPALYAALGSMLAPGRSADSSGRAAAAVEAPQAVRPGVVGQRAEFAVLEVWARALSDDQGVADPAAVPAADDLGARVRAACTVLRVAVWWIASSWAAAGDCAREVRALYDDARSVVGAADLPARMGRCPQLVHGAACGAELLLPSGQQVVRCAWCGSTYPPGTWAALRVAQKSMRTTRGVSTPIDNVSAGAYI